MHLNPQCWMSGLVAQPSYPIFYLRHPGDSYKARGWGAQRLRALVLIEIWIQASVLTWSPPRHSGSQPLVTLVPEDLMSS